jgi:hypothetical protein
MHSVALVVCVEQRVVPELESSAGAARWAPRLTAEWKSAPRGMES